MARVEHPPYDFLVDAKSGSKTNAGKATLPESHREGRFGRHAGRHRNVVFAWLGGTGLRDWVAVIDASG